MDTGHKYLYPLSPPPLPLKHENNAPVLDLSPYPRQRILPLAKTSALLFLWGGWGGGGFMYTGRVMSTGVTMLD